MLCEFVSISTLAKNYNMKKITVLLGLSILMTLGANAEVAEIESDSLASNDTTETLELDSAQLMALLNSAMLDSIANSFTYQTGEVLLDGEFARLHVPAGYKFLNAEQSNTVLVDLWGNQPTETLGLLFIEDQGPSTDNFSYAIEVSFSAEGYIEDDDAEDIDYDDLLEEMQGDIAAGNDQRRELGYSTVELVGWASTPFYDAENKKLHWAKELMFEGQEKPTLNYDIRILGRKGVLSLNVIGDIDALPKVKEDIPKIIGSAEFTEGNHYNDFNPDIDKIAAYGIGGLIAGKMLLKAGFLAKFGKIIVVGVVAAIAGIRKFFGKKDA